MSAITADPNPYMWTQETSTSPCDQTVPTIHWEDNYMPKLANVHIKPSSSRNSVESKIPRAGGQIEAVKAHDTTPTSGNKLELKAWVSCPATWNHVGAPIHPWHVPFKCVDCTTSPLALQTLEPCKAMTYIHLRNLGRSPFFFFQNQIILVVRLACLALA